jgi:hypothetical protein
MNSGIDNNVDWTAAPPKGQRVGPGLAARNALPKEHTASSVMDTLLGENQLSAVDVAGNDPYNATGRHFRR